MDNEEMIDEIESYFNGFKKTAESKKEALLRLEGVVRIFRKYTFTNAVPDPITSFQELRKRSGMNQAQIANYFGVPLRTVQHWETDSRHCRDYVLRLMEYKLLNEGIIKRDPE